MKKAEAKRRASAIEQADLAVADALTPVRDSRAVKALGALSDVGERRRQHRDAPRYPRHHISP